MLKQAEACVAPPYAIAYFDHLLDKYGKGRERRTVITSFDSIKAEKVVANNAKLYINRNTGSFTRNLKKACIIFI